MHLFNPIMWLFAAIVDWAIIGCGFALALTADWVWLPLAVLIIGNRQHAIGILAHEGVHYLVCRPPWLNDLLTRIIASGPMTISLTGYRKFHLDHHRNLGSNDDPEMSARASAGTRFTAPRSVRRIALDCVADCLGLNLLDTIGFYRVTTLGQSRTDFWLLIFTLAASIGLCFTSWWWFPVLWFTCFATTGRMFDRLRIWTEHIGTATTHRLSLPWLVDIICRPHAVGYHWEHHAAPGVPWYMLPLERHLQLDPPVIGWRSWLRAINTAGQ